MLIEAAGLGYAYPRGPRVLEEVDHRFQEGSVTAITGPSGCGKSTLLYLLALLVTPDVGTIRWDEDDVATLPDASRAKLRARYSGFVFQDAMLDPALTTLDNVLEPSWLAGVPRRTATRRAMELLEQLDVAALASHRPGEVSGGQAQRVALARAMINQPRVIFADEPTGNLDEDTAEVVWQILGRAAHDGSTVIVATHDVRRATAQPHHLVLEQR